MVWQGVWCEGRETKSEDGVHAPEAIGQEDVEGVEVEGGVHVHHDHVVDLGHHVSRLASTRQSLGERGDGEGRGVNRGGRYHVSVTVA